jgi:ABC-type glycerol-3-phosphate transport system permease component
MLAIKINNNILLSVLILILALPYFGPTLWLVMASLSTNNQIITDPLSFPNQLNYENYLYAWNKANLSNYVGNSLIVSSFTSILTVILATMLGYAITKLIFPGRRFIYLIIITGIVMPVFAYMEPLIRITRTLGIGDSLIALILTTTATYLPVPTLLMSSFFAVIPNDFIDAGRVEGVSELNIFMFIMIPLAIPGLLTIIIFSFLWAWNDILLPSIFLSSADKYTVPMAILTLKENQFRQDHVVVFAAAIISTVPMIIVYLFFMKQFITGLTSGGLRG